MKIKRNNIKAIAAVLAAATLTGCATNEIGSVPETTNGTESAGGSLVGVGASSQGEAQNTWIASFAGIQPGINITYDPAGSGAGRENFQQGASDFAGSDRPFTEEELMNGPFVSCSPESKIVQLPVYVSRIAVVFNLPGIESLNLDAGTVAAIFSGEISNWDDPRIASLNPAANLPDATITPVHRADKSGTTATFTNYLSEQAPADWTYGGVEEWPLQSGESAPQTSGMVNAVSAGSGTIGYVDASRAADLAAVNIGVGGQFVSHSDTAAEPENSYPIALQSYLIACEEYLDTTRAPLVKEYLGFVVSEEGQRIAAENAGSTPIAESVREELEAQIAAIS